MAVLSYNTTAVFTNKLSQSKIATTNCILPYNNFINFVNFSGYETLLSTAKFAGETTGSIAS